MASVSLSDDLEDSNDEEIIRNIEDVLIEPNDFILENSGNIRDFYRIGKIIGVGTFAQVRLSINKSTGA